MTFTHTHTHDLRPLPTSHDPRHLATLRVRVWELDQSGTVTRCCACASSRFLFWRMFFQDWLLVKKSSSIDPETPEEAIISVFKSYLVHFGSFKRHILYFCASIMATITMKAFYDEALLKIAFKHCYDELQCSWCEVLIALAGRIAWPIL